MLIRAEEDMSDLCRPLSYCRALWTDGPPLYVLTDPPVIYTPTGTGVKGLWSHQHKVRVGCGSPYQVLNTSRRGAPQLPIPGLHHPPGKSFLWSNMTLRGLVLVDPCCLVHTNKESCALLSLKLPLQEL